MANDTGGFVLKTQYNTEKPGLEKKFDDGSNKNTNSGLIKKKQIIILRSIILKESYLVLLAQLLLLLSMLLRIRYQTLLL